MKKTPFALAAIGALAISGTAIAAESDFGQIDVDGDGQITFEEAVAANPDWTADLAASLDVDGNGMLNQEEYDSLAAVEPSEDSDY